MNYGELLRFIGNDQRKWQEFELHIITLQSDRESGAITRWHLHI